MNDKTPLPIVCTLTPQQMREGRHDLLPGWIERAASVSELEDGLRLSFLPHPGLLKQLADTMEREQSCCSFLRFRLDVEPQMAGVTLDVTGPQGTRELLLSWASRGSTGDGTRQ